MKTNSVWLIQPERYENWNDFFTLCIKVYRNDESTASLFREFTTNTRGPIIFKMGDNVSTHEKL